MWYLKLCVRLCYILLYCVIKFGADIFFQQVEFVMYRPYRLYFTSGSKYLFETIGQKRKGSAPAARWSVKPIWLRTVTVHNIHYVLFRPCFFDFAACQSGLKKDTRGEVRFSGGQSPRKIFGTKTSAKKRNKCFYHAKNETPLTER